MMNRLRNPTQIDAYIGTLGQNQSASIRFLVYLIGKQVQ